MHDWLLVIAAYNGGPGRVYDAMKKSGSRNFWDLQYYLPQESRNHVKKFIATHYVMEANGGTGLMAKGSGGNIEENPYDNNPALTATELENAQKQTISGKYNSTVIAKHLSMELVEFNKYNPMFDLRLGKNGQFDLLLPADKMQLFLANRYTILNESVQLLLGEPDIPATRTVYPKKPLRKKGK
jgi:membrane-bound lytic murein transglycosylase D